MKVLQVSTHVNIGGIGNYILSLSGALKGKGIEVVASSSGGDLEDEFKKIGIPHRHLDIMTKSELSPKVLKSVFEITRLIKEEGIDIIHAHTRVSQVVSFFASRMTGAPYVTTCHGFFKTRFRKIFDTWGERVIAISDAVREHLKSDLGVSEDRIDLIYSGVDPARFAKEYSPEEITSIKRSMGLKSGPVVGTIGRLSPVKGQRFLVRAMKDVIHQRPNAQTLIVGDGDEGASLRKLARSLDIEDSVHFLHSTLDTARVLAVMDIFVFPSVKEGLGIALLEALASGRPCVASNVGGIGDIIENGSNGMLVTVEDSAAIRNAILLLLADEALRKSMSKRGSILVREKFSLDSMADNVIGMYNRVVSNEL